MSNHNKKINWDLKPKKINDEEDFIKDKNLKDDLIKQKRKIKRVKRASQFEGVNHLQLNEDLPKKNETIKYLSKYHINSMHFINWIANEEFIEYAFLVTFRLGKKQREQLVNLQNENKIGKIDLVVSQVQFQNDLANQKKNENKTNYNYFEDIEKLKSEKGWGVHLYNTHSKIYLLKTKLNYYVVESSGNLNGNPKNEFFILNNSIDDYNFYKNFFESEIGEKNGKTKNN